MKRFLLVLSLLALACASFAQVLVKVDLTRDNKGKPGAAVRTLSPSDNPFHCVLQMKPLPSAMTLSARLIAVRAGDVVNYTVASADQPARPGMDSVDFKFSLPRPWPIGSYRIDLRSNGTLLRSIPFEVR